MRVGQGLAKSLWGIPGETAKGGHKILLGDILGKVFAGWGPKVERLGQV